MIESKEPGFEPESESALSDEEIDFLKDEVHRVQKTVKDIDVSVGSKSIAEANWFFNHPELGMQEERSSQFLTQRLSSILGKENVAEIGGGVCGILEGSEENGATIFLRGDMDALPLSEGEAAHMCGHNIHMAWLLENARLLSAYKEHFSELPFKKIVFIGEPNEEGIASPDFGPQKMIEAGLIEKTGKPDFVIGAHFVAPQPEGEVRIDRETASYGDGRFHYKLIPKDADQDVKKIAYEFIYQVGQTWQNEDPNAEFGKLLIVPDSQAATPETMVRATDTKPISEERYLRPNILNEKEEVELSLQPNQDMETIENIIKKIEAGWNGEVQIIITLNESNLKISVQSKGGHISQGGPNVKYIMAEIIHNLGEKQNFVIKDGNESLEIVGSFRTRAKDWEGEGHRIGQKLQEIIVQTVGENSDSIKIEGNVSSIDNPPVINDDNMRNSALNVLKKAEIPITTVGMAIAPAETFVFWESELKIPGLYITIGGGDKNELENIKDNKLPLPAKYLHHTPAILDLIHANRAIPYGGVLSLIALEIGKKFNK